jgi:hypothetical protein
MLSADFSAHKPTTETDDLKQQQVGAHHADLRLVCARTPDRRRDLAIRLKNKAVQRALELGGIVLPKIDI